MGIAEILLLGVALSMDAFAVTVSNVIAYPHEARSRMALLPIAFGLFQGIMPVGGYFLGTLAADLIEQCAGIVTLAILGLIGGSMIREGVLAMRESDRDDGPEHASRHLSVKAILAQAVATSIDAFAVGVSLLAGGANIALSAVVIALTTAALCAAALVIARRVGNLLGDWAQVIGGVVLVAIGIKALF